MNVFSYEFRCQIKNFIVWTVSLLLIFILFNTGMYKVFIDSRAAFEQMAESLPPAFAAAFGFVITELFTFSGFYTFVYTYIAVIGAIMAVTISLAVFSREKNSKCVDFLLTKPLSRARIFAAKLLVCLMLIAAMNILYIAAASAVYSGAGQEPSGLGRFILAACALFFTQIVFMCFGILFAVFARKVRSVSGVATAIGFAGFILSALHSLLEKEAIRFVSPLKYFDPRSVFAGGGFETEYVVTAIVIIAAGVWLSYYRYVRSDVAAV